MENDFRKTRRAGLLLRPLGWGLALVAALAVATWIMPSRWRSGMLRLAEGVGLYQEAEHEMAAVRDAEGNILYWTCTMHPWVRAEGPGTCPV